MRDQVRVGVLLAAGAGIAVAAASADHVRKDRQFNRDVQLTQAAIQSGLDEYSRLLDGLGAAVQRRSGPVAGTEFVDRAVTAASVYQGVRALEWIPLVRDDDRAEFEQAAQADYPGFEIRELLRTGQAVRARTRPLYFPVRIVVPLGGNEKVVGLDLYSEKLRRSALDEAALTGRQVATDPVVLVQGATNQFGFLLIRPIVGDGWVRGESGVAALRGVVLGVYDISQLIHSLIGPVGSRAPGLWIEDQRFGIRLFESTPEIGPAVPPWGVQLRRSNSLSVGGRTWNATWVRQCTPFGHIVIGVVVLLGFAVVSMRYLYPRRADQV